MSSAAAAAAGSASGHSRSQSFSLATPRPPSAMSVFRSSSGFFCALPSTASGSPRCSHGEAAQRMDVDRPRPRFRCVGGRRDASHFDIPAHELRLDPVLERERAQSRAEFRIAFEGIVELALAHRRPGRGEQRAPFGPAGGHRLERLGERDHVAHFVHVLGRHHVGRLPHQRAGGREVVDHQPRLRLVDEIDGLDDFGSSQLARIGRGARRVEDGAVALPLHARDPGLQELDLLQLAQFRRIHQRLGNREPPLGERDVARRQAAIDVDEASQNRMSRRLCVSASVRICASASSACCSSFA